MNSKLLNYKGYYGTIEVDQDDDFLTGQILHINDLVTYQADTVKELKEEFQNSVDDYLHLCEELGREPQKPYKGTFNIRITPENHKKLALRASLEDRSINEAVKEAIDCYLDKAANEVTHSHKVEFQFSIENQTDDEQASNVPVSFKSIKLKLPEEDMPWIS